MIEIENSGLQFNLVSKRYQQVTSAKCAAHPSVVQVAIRIGQMRSFIERDSLS